MTDINTQVISQLSQIITQIAEGKLNVEHLNCGLRDNSVKHRDHYGNVFLEKGCLTRTYELKLTENKQ